MQIAEKLYKIFKIIKFLKFNKSIKIVYIACGLRGRPRREVKAVRKQHCRKMKPKTLWPSINRYPWLLAHNALWNAFGLSYLQGYSEELIENTKPLLNAQSL